MSNLKERALEDLIPETTDRLHLAYDRGYYAGLADRQQHTVTWLRAQRGREVSPARLADELEAQSPS